MALFRARWARKPRIMAKHKTGSTFFDRGKAAELGVVRNEQALWDFSPASGGVEIESDQ